MPQIVNSPPNPNLVLLDTSARQNSRSPIPDVIQFKFQPQDFSIDGVASAYASSTGLNRAFPILQYSHGEQRGFSFTMRLWAKDSTDQSPQSDLDALTAAIAKDDDLGRPPRFQFIWGSFINETVVVKTIGNVRVGQLRPDGTLREATLSVNLLVYQPVDVSIATADDKPSNTFYSVTKRGDQWEDIALREYDEPGYGDALRQTNPKIMFPGAQPGAIVILPKLANIANTIVEPTSIPLKRTAEGLALRLQMYQERSVSRQSAILKK